MQALAEFSKDAKVFVLIHKMDMVPEKERIAVFVKTKYPRIGVRGEEGADHREVGAVQD